MRRDDLRRPFGYVVEIKDSDLLINLSEESRALVSGHPEGVSSIGRPGDLIGAEGGTNIIVARVSSIAFAEPKEIHLYNTESTQKRDPLRQMRASVIGYLSREQSVLRFTAQNWVLPVLGASTFPLSDNEMRTTIGTSNTEKERIVIGNDSRNSLVPLPAGIDELLARHFAILGSTGQGKTHFVAAFLQELMKERKKARIVIFDVNGEYWKAFKDNPLEIKRTILGKNTPEKKERGFESTKIPYYALGRHGLGRLLLPSEKTQAPALRFAIEHMKYTQADEKGARPYGEQKNVFFDDCRGEDAEKAFNKLEKIKQAEIGEATLWPHMKALSCLAAEWYCLKPDKYGQKRDAFSYNHIHPLINRINALISDEKFTEIIDVSGGPSCIEKGLNLPKEGKKIVENFFGNKSFQENDWNVHIIDLSALMQDLMPFILGALLELYASELFIRGPGSTHPTLLVLEEAHHYLRQLPGDSETGQHSLAYERLAKEGRKFGLSLLLSTQRPSELSSTVLAQCNTLAVFRLMNDNDQRSVASAAENVSQHIIKQIPGLARGEAVVFGSAIPLACRIKVIRPNPEPDSSDARFIDKWSQTA